MASNTAPPISYERLLVATRDAACLVAEHQARPWPGAGIEDVLAAHGLDLGDAARAADLAAEIHLARLALHWQTLPLATHVRRLFTVALLAGVRLRRSDDPLPPRSLEHELLGLVSRVHALLEIRLEPGALPALDVGLGGAHRLLSPPLRGYATRVVDAGLALGLGPG